MGNRDIKFFCVLDAQGEEEVVEEDVQYGTSEDTSLRPDLQGDYWDTEDVRRRMRKWGAQGRKKAR